VPGSLPWRRLSAWPPGAAQDGQKVAYITSQGERLLAGVVRIGGAGASGILCACCRAVISCSQFEAHAGRGSRRAPYDNIFTAAGVSLRRVAMLMPAAEAEEPAHYRAARGAGAPPAGARCAATAAPSRWHMFIKTSRARGALLARLGPGMKAPGFGWGVHAALGAGAWARCCAMCAAHCWTAAAGGCAPAWLPARMPSAGRDREVGGRGRAGAAQAVADAAAAAGGCVLCQSPDFLRDGFGPRTMIICDQCEREFHVGCLASTGRAHLSELPEGAARPAGVRAAAPLS
jgi:hypothetical protein